MSFWVLLPMRDGAPVIHTARLDEAVEVVKASLSCQNPDGSFNAKIAGDLVPVAQEFVPLTLRLSACDIAAPPEWSDDLQATVSATAAGLGDLCDRLIQVHSGVSTEEALANLHALDLMNCSEIFQRAQQDYLAIFETTEDSEPWWWGLEADQWLGLDDHMNAHPDGDCNVISQAYSDCARSIAIPLLEAHLGR